MAPLPRTCERIRALTSVALDGELSEIEQAMLTVHLRRCDACDGYAREITGLTRMLRDAPLESLPFPIAVQRRRSVRRSVHGLARVAAAAAVAAVAVGLGASLLPGHSGATRRSGLRAPVPPITDAQLVDERLNWPAGLPRVKSTELALEIGQRSVSLDS